MFFFKINFHLTIFIFSNTGSGVFGTLKIVKWNVPVNDFFAFHHWQWAFWHALKSLSGIGKDMAWRFQQWQWAFQHAVVWCKGKAKWLWLDRHAPACYALLRRTLQRSVLRLARSRRRDQCLPSVQHTW